MLEELQTIALVGLLVPTYFLTIGCRNISGLPLTNLFSLLALKNKLCIGQVHELIRIGMGKWVK